MAKAGTRACERGQDHRWLQGAASLHQGCSLLPIGHPWILVLSVFNCIYMRLLAVFDVLKHSATEDSTYAEEEEEEEYVLT